MFLTQNSYKCTHHLQNKSPLKNSLPAKQPNRCPNLLLVSVPLKANTRLYFHFIAKVVERSSHKSWKRYKSVISVTLKGLSLFNGAEAGEGQMTDTGTIVQISHGDTSVSSKTRD